MQERRMFETVMFALTWLKSLRQAMEAILAA